MKKTADKQRGGRNNHLNDIPESLIIGDDGVRLDEKLKYSGKYLQDEINDIIDGKTVIGLAKDLYSAIDQDYSQGFIKRTTANGTSIRTGKAQLKLIKGTLNNPTGTTADSNISKLLVEKCKYNVTVTDEEELFEVLDEDGTYEFVYTDDHFTCSAKSVTAENAGMTVTGIFVANDKIKVTISGQTYSIVLAPVARITYTVNEDTMKTKLYGGTAGTPGQTYSMTATYNGSKWKDTAGHNITPSDYGFTISNTSALISGDQIVCAVTRGDYGTLGVATPTYLLALGLNSCKNTGDDAMIIKDYSIDFEGNVVYSPGYNICYAECVYHASANGYTIYDENNTIVKVGHCTSKPTTTTTGITLGTVSGKVNNVAITSSSKYVVCVCTNTKKICIHPKWSGYLDGVYVEYNESKIAIPTQDASGNTISLVYLNDTYYNDINYSTKKYNKRVERINYTPTALVNLLSEKQWTTASKGTKYNYDNNYIYYIINLVSTNIDVSVETTYDCHDFSIEEFLGTDYKVYATMTYGQNLVDKLRNDVITASNVDSTVASKGYLKTPISEDEYIRLRDGGGLNITKTYLVKLHNGEVKTMATPYTSVRIDQSGLIKDPAKIITGDIGYGQSDINVIAWIKRNSHRYVTKFNTTTNKIDAILLDDILGTTYIKTDGTSGGDATTDMATVGKDVMMRLPKFWYKAVNCVDEDDNSYIELSFANTDAYFSNEEADTWNCHDSNAFLGVYEAYVPDTTTPADALCYSVSGQTPTVSYSQANFKTAARNRYNSGADDGYRIVDYEMHKIMCLLGLAYYGNTNIQEIVGYGTSSYKQTGGTNTKGMIDSMKDVDGNLGSHNFWGIENWWGDIAEFMDDLITANSTGLINIKSYNGNTNIRQVQSNLPRSANKCITKLVFGKCADVIPDDGIDNSNYNTNYADYGYVAAGSGSVAHRSYYAALAYGGLAYLDLYYGSSGASANIGSRLLYRGGYSIVDSFE